MSTEVEDAVPAAVPAGPSLEQQIADREREKEQSPEHAIILPVPGFEDLMSVQYRALGVREMFKLEKRHEAVKDPYDQTLLTIADKLLAACERIVRPTGTPDEYADTGYRWGTQAALSLFHRDLPAGATERQGLLAIFHGDEAEEALIDHFAEYEKQRKATRQRLDRSLTGESVASSAGI